MLERERIAQEIRAAKERSSVRKKAKESKQGNIHSSASPDTSSAQPSLAPLFSPIIRNTRKKSKSQRQFPSFSRRIEGVIKQQEEPQSVLIGKSCVLLDFLE